MPRSSTGPVATANSNTSRPLRLVTFWVMLRLPLLAVAAVFLRQPISELLERLGFFTFAVHSAIYIQSTLVGRFAFFAVCLVALLVSVFVLRRLLRSPALVQAGVSTVAAVFFLAAFWRAGHAHWLLTGTTLAFLTALNTVPAAWLDALRGRLDLARNLNSLVVLVPGLPELLLPRLWWEWLGRRMPSSVDSRRVGDLATAASVVTLSALAALLVQGSSLINLDRRLRANPDVAMIAAGDFNGMEIDLARKVLFVAGHGLDRIWRLDLNDVNAAPVESSASVAGAQGLAYDSAGQRIFAQRKRENTMLCFDAGTMQLQRSWPTPHIAPGDSWFSYDEATDRLVVASEADEKVGHSFVVFQCADGKVVDTRPITAGNMTLHPSRPWLYLSFFRESRDLLRYDVATSRIAAQVPSDRRAERMLYWESADELLVTSPLNSRILRYDAETLASKGSIPAMLGVRALAIDTRRNLLVCASITGGKLQIIDLNTFLTVKKIHLGPWLRTICLDEETGLAYVSSAGALYQVRYTSG